MCISNRSCSNISKTVKKSKYKVVRNAKLDSDHYLSKTKVKLQSRISRRQASSFSHKIVKKYNIEIFKHDTTFTNKLETQNSRNWEQLKESLVDTVKETLPLSKIKFGD